MKLTKLFGTLLIVIAFAGNAIAKDINSNADWASVTATDEVYIKMSGTTTIPSDITCKKIAFANGNQTIDLNGYNLNVGTLELKDRDDLKIINGGNITVSVNLTMCGHRNEIVCTNLIVGGTLNMTDRDNMKISANLSVGKDLNIKGHYCQIKGDVDVLGNVTITERNNMVIDGDISVAGDLTMSGSGNNISGTAAIHGNANISGGASITGGYIEYTGELPEEPETGDKPANLLDGWNLTNAYNLTHMSDLEECRDNIKFSVQKDHAAFGLTFNGKNLFELGYSYEGTHLNNGLSNQNQNQLNGVTEIVYFLVDTKNKKVTSSTTNPNCGPVPPTIDDIPDMCFGSTIDASKYVHWTTTGTGKWVNSSKQEIQLSNLQIGDEFYYEATDANGADPVLSNKIKVMGKPSISPIGDISYCAADGGYDLSKHIVSDNGATTTTTWKLNGTTINSSKPTLSAGDRLYVKSENVCGYIDATMNVSNGCTPKIPTLSNPTAICSGGSIVLPTPTLEYYDESLPKNTKEWQVSTDGGNTWKTFSNSNLSYSTYNGAKIRLSATNANGTSYSNEITLTVKPNTPEFTVSSTGSSVTESLGGSSSSVTYTVNKTNECNNDDITFDISDKTHFICTKNGNQITISLKEGLDVDTYQTKVLFNVGTEHEEKTLNGSVVEYPACYDIIVDDTKEIITVCTDENGDLTLNMDDGRFANKGTMRIPKNTSIKCRNINIYNNNQYGKNMQLICDGTIECEDKFNLSNLAQNSDNSGYFITSCFSTIKAKTINISYVYSIQPFSGNWIADNIVVRNGQGQNIHFTNCSDVHAQKIDINANFSDGVKIDGHVAVDTFIVNRNLYAQDGSILTIGKEQVSGNFEAKSGSIVNICYNPNKNQADGIGTCNSCTIFYNYGDKGWDDGSNPIKEGDVTGTVGGKGLQQVYTSYEDCIGEKNLRELLPIRLLQFYVSYGFDNDFHAHWTTASEENNAYFELQQSIDGFNWITLQIVDGVINSTKNITYLVDLQFNEMPNVAYYRLKQTDINGNYSYSNVIVMKTNTDIKNLYYNPCDDDSLIKIRYGKDTYRVYGNKLIYCENDNI